MRTSEARRESPGCLPYVGPLSFAQIVGAESQRFNFLITLKLSNESRRHMVRIPDAVPESAIDYKEVFRRGGANCGDEDFALCKCPHCARIYLIEHEVDTLYLDPEKLDRRVAINIGVSGLSCEGCGGELPEKTPWIGEYAPEAMQVSWKDLESSPWRWVAARTGPTLGSLPESN